MTTRTWPMVLLLLVSIVVGLVLLREPLLKPYYARKAEVEALREDVGKLRSELLETRAAAKRRTASWQGYGDPLDVSKQAQRSSDWTRRIETLAVGAGLEVVTVQPKRPRLDDLGVVGFPLTVSLAGDSAGLTRFLSQLQTMRGVVEIERLVVRRQTRGDEPLTVQASVVHYGVLDAARREELARRREEANRKKSA